MPTARLQTYNAQVLTAPPQVKTFPAGSDAAAALVTARYWVEDRARAFLVEHSLPRNPWEAGVIFGVEVDEGSAEKPLAELVIHTEEGDYVFRWDDQS
jgi:hypothetical protein